MGTATVKPRAKLTANGEMLVERLAEERENNIKEHNGEYVPDPWYRCYLSRNFVIPTATESSAVETDMETYNMLDQIVNNHSDDEDETEKLEDTNDDYDDYNDYDDESDNY